MNSDFLFLATKSRVIQENNCQLVLFALEKYDLLLFACKIKKSDYWSHLLSYCPTYPNVTLESIISSFAYNVYNSVDINLPNVFLSRKAINSALSLCKQCSTSRQKVNKLLKFVKGDTQFGQCWFLMCFVLAIIPKCIYSELWSYPFNILMLW